jgi:hypothetical protein
MDVPGRVFRSVEPSSDPIRTEKVQMAQDEPGICPQSETDLNLASY